MAKKILALLESFTAFTLVFGGACVVFGVGLIRCLSGEGYSLIYAASMVFVCYFLLRAIVRRFDPVFRALRRVKREEDVPRQVALYNERVLPLLRQALPRTLYRYIALGDDPWQNELRFRTLEQKKLWLSTPKPLNDVFEGTNVYYSTKWRFDRWIASAEDVETRRRNLIDSLLETRKNFFTCSLSKSRESSDLWSRYAGENRGFCIEYEVTDPHCLYGVRYSGKKHDVGPVMERLNADLYFGRIGRGAYEATLMEMQKLWFTYKGVDSAKEREVRCIFMRENNHFTGLSMPEAECGLKVRGVYLGMNCSAEHRARLQHIAEALGIFCKPTEPDYYGERAVIKVADPASERTPE